MAEPDMDRLRRRQERVLYRDMTLMAALLETAEEAALNLWRLALWCPYCDDMVNPRRAAEPLAMVLECPKCEKSIAHTDWHIGEYQQAIRPAP